MINDELLHKWVNNTITSEELAVFKTRPEYDSLVALHQRTSDLAAPSFDQEAMLKNILTQSKNKKSIPSEPTIASKEKKVFSLWVKYAAVACILLSVGFFLWPKGQMVTHEVTKNQQLEGTLPGQSEFILNADSKLTYDSKRWDNNRSLDLMGEAFFKVKKGSTFTVNTSAGKVEVLGTQFNVKSRLGSFEVSCTEGKVAVNFKNKTKQEILTQGQSVRINQSGAIERMVNEAENAKSWIAGIIRLKDVYLKEVVEELERQFDVTIELEGIDTKERISCNFQNENLEMALKTATAPLNLTFEIISENKVVLKKIK